MKNKLAENLLRFGIKNLNESEVEKLQGLAEQEEPADTVSAGLLIGEMTLEVNDAPEKLSSSNGEFIIFNGNSDFNNALATVTNDCVVYRYLDNRYIAIGKIGTFNTKSNNITNPDLNAILFTPKAAETSKGKLGYTVDKVSINAKIPSVVIATILKEVVPNSKSGVADYLTKNENGKALLSGIINMYKMNSTMSDFDINDPQELRNLSTKVQRSLNNIG